MSNPWFRFYSEFASDPKVQILDETFQRRYIMFLCVSCNGDIEKRTDRELAFLFRISEEEFQNTKKALRQADLLTEQGRVKNWEKRQYLSDISTERVKRHRLKQNETFQERSETVSETPPDTEADTEADTDTDTKKKSKRFVPPTPEEVKIYCLERKNTIDPQKFVDHYTSNGWMVGKNKMKSWQAAVRTWEANDNGKSRNSGSAAQAGRKTGLVEANRVGTDWLGSGADS